jgi:hypothetical protein
MTTRKTVCKCTARPIGRFSDPIIKQRYDKLLKKNYIDRANSPIEERGYAYPTADQMRAFEKYNLPPDVDPALRNVVIELNKVGYSTGGSCQGHNHHNTAFIAINPTKEEILKAIPNNSLPFHLAFRAHTLKDGLSKRPINTSIIVNILKKHGLQNIRYEPPRVNPTTLNNSQIAAKSKRIPPGMSTKDLAQTYHAFNFKVIND